MTALTAQSAPKDIREIKVGTGQAFEKNSTCESLWYFSLAAKDKTHTRKHTHRHRLPAYLFMCSQCFHPQ